MRRRHIRYGSRYRVNDWTSGLPDESAIKRCFGKDMLNKEQARQTVARMKKRYRSTETLEFYKCRECGRWHIGNNRRVMEQ